MSAKVFIGFGVGIILGLVFQKNILFVQPLGDLFLKLIQMIVIPMVFLSIISGIASIGDIGKLRRIGAKVIGFYIITTVPTSQIINTDEPIKAAEPMTVSQTILSMIPTNPLEALATGNLIQVIVFAVFIGIAITILGNKVSNVKRVIDEANLIMFKITDIVMKVTPYGVAALVACSVGQYGLSIFNILGKFILTHYIGAFSVVFIMYTFIIKYIAKISLKDFFTKITEVWLVAFSTTSSSGTLPVTLRVTEEKFNVKDELAAFSLPIGATINMNGIAVYYAVTVLFVAQVYGVDLTLMQQVMFIFMTTLISIGTPGIPNSGIVLTIMLLTTMGLPIEIMGMIVGIFRLIDMIHTALNVTGDVVSTLAVARIEHMYKK